MSNTYRKTKAGTWAVYGPAAEIKPELTVTVTKKDGTTKLELIDSVGKTFIVDGVEMVYGYPVPTTPAPRQYRRSGTSEQVRTYGNIAPAACDNCGRHGATHLRHDSSGLSGKVCASCNREADYELSFA